MMRVSFIIPVYNTQSNLLKLCVNSVLKSAEANHEVIIVDDASNSEDTLKFLDKCKSSSINNINIVTNSVNSGVSYSLNHGSRIASGDFLSPVDHDDVVVTSGFSQILRYLDYYKSAWAYSDEIQVDEKGFLIRRMYKPDFSLQLLRSTMYINHLQVFSTELFRGIGGYREGFEGSQDHDLALRMSEKVEPIHADTIAYHWRILKNTQSRSGDLISTDSIDNSVKALEEHFKRIGKIACVDSVLLQRDKKSSPTPTGVYQCRISPENESSMSVIIPCKLGTKKIVAENEIELLPHCLERLEHMTRFANFNQKDNALEVVIVINSGDDEKKANEMLSHYGLTGKVISDEPGFNFARKCNIGAQSAKGDILVFLNDDTYFETEDWVFHISSLLVERDIACVGGMLLNADRSVQSCGDNIGRNSAVHYAPHPIASSVGDPMHRYLADHETTSVSGAFLSCKKETFNKLRGFSESFPNSFQDVDFCLRARAEGMRCITAPRVRVLHFESATRDAKVDPNTLSALQSFHGPGLAGADRFAFWRYQPIHFSIFSYNGIKVRTLNIMKIIFRFIRFMEKRLTRNPRCWRGVLRKDEYKIP